MSDGSDPPSGERPQSTSSHKRGSGLPHSIELANFDKAIILFLIAVFLVLFVWLLSKNIQPPTYACWNFTALLTMIFVGFLHATGVYEPVHRRHTAPNFGMVPALASLSFLRTLAHVSAGCLSWRQHDAAA
jgi:O-antigen ligase